MNFTPKTALASFLAVAVLSLLLLASPEPRTAIAQQPDYTAQCSNGIAVPNPQNNTGLVQDCAALLASKDTLDPDGQVLNWSSDALISEWEGISLESRLDGGHFRNRVVRLSFSGNDDRPLTGNISHRLGILIHLKELNLSHNQLTGSIPAELGNLTDLQWLYLNRNQLTGNIPSELGNISYRRVVRNDYTYFGGLYLNDNQLTGSIPSALGNTTHLWQLNLSNNQLTGNIPPELGNITFLRYLYLSGNQLVGCIPVSLRDMDYHDFDALGLPICDETQRTDSLTADICSNGVVVPAPQNNPGLVQDCIALVATRNAFNDTHGRFDWSGDTPIEEWHGINVESTLDGGYFRNRVDELSISDVTGSISPELGNLSTLRRLYFENNQLTGSIPPELGNLANLQRMRLNENQLTGSIPPELGNLANLQRMYLSENQLTGSIPPELGNLANLQRMRLNENQLTGSIPPELGNLANLQRMRLNENQLTGAIPPELGNLPNLQDLYLSGNQLTGCIPASLSELDDHDFASLNLPLCDVAQPEPTPTVIPTVTPTPTPIAPAVPVDVLNRLSAIESLLATLQSLISALESRIVALESDASRPTPTPAPVVPTPTPVHGEPTPTPNDPCIDEFTNSGSKNGSWDADCESVTSRRILVDSGRGDGPHHALYYTFTLTASANVTVTLDSDDQDTFLYLLAGKGANVGEIGALDMRHYNDDHGSHQDTDACANDSTLEEYDSCITKSLAAGDYTLEATTYNSRATGSFILTVSGIR